MQACVDCSNISPCLVPDTRPDFPLGNLRSQQLPGPHPLLSPMSLRSLDEFCGKIRCLRVAPWKRDSYEEEQGGGMGYIYYIMYRRGI